MLSPIIGDQFCFIVPSREVNVQPYLYFKCVTTYLDIVRTGKLVNILYMCYLMF